MKVFNIYKKYLIFIMAFFPTFMSRIIKTKIQFVDINFMKTSEHLKGCLRERISTKNQKMTAMNISLFNTDHQVETAAAEEEEAYGASHPWGEV